MECAIVLMALVSGSVVQANDPDTAFAAGVIHSAATDAFASIN